jgi:hypothetical protein
MDAIRSTKPVTPGGIPPSNKNRTLLAQTLCVCEPATPPSCSLPPRILDGWSEEITGNASHASKSLA